MPDQPDGASFTDLLAAMYRQALAEAYAEADREIDRLIYGNGTGVPRGILSWEERPPTPVERAFAILDPHLRSCPLYDAGPPALYPHTWKVRP